ncbi:tRNA-dihydrouridine synthase, partial [Candidatus Parcubacteria bacterium]|nr:tRNA-dihydrouridine synthase [Candidatus Parcubacteria bacterium]
EDIAVLTVHARTRKEMSKIEANWDYVKTVVNMRNDWADKNPGKIIPLIFGNGDVVSVEDGFDKCEKYNADGAMIGRAMFGNPWFFKDIEEKFIPTREDRINTLIRQVEVFDRELGDVKSFAVMKKFFKTYMNGFEDAKDIREAIMNMEKAEEVVNFLKEKADTR